MVQLIDTNTNVGVTAPSFDDIVIYRDVTLFGTPAVDAATATSYSINVLVEGTALSASGFAVDLLGSSDGSATGTGGHTVTVGAQGAVRSLALHGVGMRGSDNIVTNHGEISGITGMGLFLQGTGQQVFNHGSISSNWGILLQDVSGSEINRIVNHGTIEGTGAAAIDITGGELELVNGGVMLGTSTTGGTIHSDSTYSQSIVNTGTISGDVAIDLRGTGEDTVINSGLILGDVRLGDGADSFDGRGGHMPGAVHGGQGNDEYILDDPNHQIEEDPGGGTDTIWSLTGFILPANVENLFLRGTDDLRGEGNELDNALSGWLGDDTLAGNGGDDAIQGHFGADLLLGGAGSDTASYGASQAWVNVSLLTGFTGGGAGSHAVGDTLIEIENLAGSALGDRLSGDHAANRLAGMDGDDILRGRGGSDELNGGIGRDTADYADSAGWVNVSLQTGFTGGGAGSHALGDELLSIENLTGSRFSDRLNGGSGDNVLEGLLGADTLDGNDGSDTASYASSGAGVNVSLLTGFAGGASGSHAIGDSFEQIENLTGSDHADILNGDNGANALEGGRGDDLLRGNGGADLFVFRDGHGQDTVADFTDGSDQFTYSNHDGITVLADLDIGVSGADATITDPAGNVVLVTGAAGLIDAGDFVF